MSPATRGAKRCPEGGHGPLVVGQHPLAANHHAWGITRVEIDWPYVRSCRAEETSVGIITGPRSLRLLWRGTANRGFLTWGRPQWEGPAPAGQ